MEKHGKRRIFQSPSHVDGTGYDCCYTSERHGECGGNCPHHPGGPYLCGPVLHLRHAGKTGSCQPSGRGQYPICPFIPTPEGTEKARELSELFANAGIKTRAFDAAEQIQWYKLVWNIPFNGLCLALGGISIAELYQNPENVMRARRIMEEVVQAAKARGYALPEDLVEFHLSRTETMGAFIPSSAVDYNEGRPVEYTAIWGDPLSKARQAGASVPEWELLDKAIRKRLNIN